MNLDNIDTKNCLFNPKSPSFLDEIEREEPFKIRPYKVSSQSILTYIVLVYDPESQLFKKEQDSIRRKEIAAKASDMPYDKKTGFSKETIDILIGKNEKVNEAIAHYIYLSNSIHIMALCTYELYYERLIRDSFISFDFEPKNAEIISKLLEKILSLRKELLGGEEIHAIHKALTSKMRKVSDTLRIENINKQFLEDGLEEFNPYPDNYQPDNIKFVGDKIPE